jgi:Alanine dehydrogenase/PNT, C-terminal domain
MMTPMEIISAMQVSLPSCPNPPVYAIVPKNGPVSFYSQQKRAFNLISALRTEGRLPSGTKVGVIGAGLAGITASAAAHLLGCNVTLFEANQAKFHQQHGNHSRYIHPNVIDWPLPGSESPVTDLPFLNWMAGECASVVEDIEDQWNALGIKLEAPANYRVDGFRNDAAYITSTRFYRKEFNVVIVAVGFGPESRFGLNQKSYWSDEDWGQLLSTDGKRSSRCPR